MKSRFYFLAKDYSDLYKLCSEAEETLNRSLEHSVISSRKALEVLSFHLVGTRGDLRDRINQIQKSLEADRDIITAMHTIRRIGNKGAHPNSVELEAAQDALDKLVQVMIWYVFKVEANAFLTLDDFHEQDYALVKSYRADISNTVELLKIAETRAKEAEAELQKLDPNYVLPTEKACYEKIQQVKKDYTRIEDEAANTRGNVDCLMYSESTPSLESTHAAVVETQTNYATTTLTPISTVPVDKKSLTLLAAVIAAVVIVSSVGLYYFLSSDTKQKVDNIKLGTKTIIINTDKSTDNSEAIYNALRNLKVGDTVKFGKYFMVIRDSYFKDPKPLEWKVLDVKDDLALLITKDAITTLPYVNDKSVHRTDWASSYAKRQLDFIIDDEECFSKVEKDMVVYHRQASGKLFVLNKSEVEHYMPNEKDRLCKQSYIARYHREYNIPNSGWLLRGEEGLTSGVTYVDASGKIITIGARMDKQCPVRLCLWLKLKK